ncbi:MAG: right-handed parallel beta-helix repeat-containing protein [Acidobacteriia bacterium]|nr:right-handed parallel beta-helix repeat-containing protein [Terriglobia bacterium]
MSPAIAVNSSCGRGGGNKKNCPPAVSLTAQPGTIELGQSSTLSWASQNATTLDLEPWIGAVGAQGSVSVSPEQTTTYILTAANTGGTTAASATITVNAASGVELSPDDDLQAAVDAHAAGTSFILAPGVYRMQSVVPKNGDTFTGQTGAVLNGSLLVSSWQQVSSGWVAQGSGITQAAWYRGVCLSGHPACIYPEDLFFDSQPLTRVGSLSLVGPGTWYFDYGAQKAYVGTNPAGHTTELSVLRHAFSGTASNVRIANLTIEKYASISGQGAVQATSDSWAGSSGWVVDSNEIRLNHGWGVRVSEGTKVTNNKIHDNGQMGLGGSGKGILIENNEVYGNNYAAYSPRWEAGGTKFSFSTNLIVRGNYSHDNYGPGLWTDINNDYVLYEHNHTSRNFMAGIDHEISFHATIRYNEIDNDGFASDGTTSSIWWGDGILVANSSEVEVYGNTVTNCMNGIGGIQQDRGLAPDGAPYSLKNLNVHDNTVTQQVNYASGIVKATNFDDSVYTSWGNHFSNNVFNLSNPSGKYFIWLSQQWTYAQWLSYWSIH